MENLLPQAYLIGLVVLLGGAAVVVARQIWKVRQDEVTLARLERQGGQGAQTEARDAASLYELGSVQLRKRLFGQAVESLSEARQLATAEEAPAEALALIENALGFALAAQKNYKTALKHYRAALKAKPDYPVALNNLAYALEKEQDPEQARATYQKVLELDSGNRTALKRLNRLERTQGKAA
ncbi:MULTISPECIES: tetratricopeptide repeat protein [unclassified Cyanobium]|uniref:tetratricopeptide repeat protein n=1 Tax=unclassified Cyanobium TaxID=2627006 RepID=UPI0016443BCB|nr:MULTISPECIES: tetratricopeptide repeat protein [unclassified Cyanobium]MBE9154760.1 tetratricopeptide repeat protein [Cyanobium sp. LEGE 06113]QNI69227.1 photosystem I assembly protein Ycf37 [Cyanobium sp. NS01]